MKHLTLTSKHQESRERIWFFQTNVHIVQSYLSSSLSFGSHWADLPSQSRLSLRQNKTAVSYVLLPRHSQNSFKFCFPYPFTSRSSGSWRAFISLRERQRSISDKKKWIFNPDLKPLVQNHSLPSIPVYHWNRPVRVLLVAPNGNTK